MITIFRLLPPALLLLPTLALATEIYKTYDEDGNVVYTDQKPSEDARPVELPDLTIMDAPDIRPASPQASQTRTGETRDIDFRIASPQPEEHLHGTANTVPVRLQSSVSLPAGGRIVLYLNGQPLAPISGLSTSIPDVPRGEHTLRAELQAAGGRVLASTETVTFHMRQASALHPTP